MANLSNEPDTVARFVDAGSAKAREAVDRLSSSATRSVDRLAAGAQDALAQATDRATGYAARGDELARQARDRMAAYPWRTLAIAAAAGFLIARILR